MIVFETIAVAFAMFSAIPVPQPTWGARNMRYVLCALPLIGLVIALAQGVWVLAANRLLMPLMLRGAGLCLIPVLLTGGIHLDGYADTSDALASCAPPEKKQEILKDPHCGAFAVIRLGVWFVASFALCTAVRLDGPALFCFGAGFVLSRTLSGWAVAALPLAKNTGLAHTFATAADRVRVRRVLLGLALVLSVCMCVVGRAQGSAMAAAICWVMVWYIRMCKKQFGGLSGDLAGWFLQTSELWMLAAQVAVQLLEAAL